MKKNFENSSCPTVSCILNIYIECHKSMTFNFQFLGNRPNFFTSKVDQQMCNQKTSIFQTNILYKEVLYILEISQKIRNNHGTFVCQERVRGINYSAMILAFMKKKPRFMDSTDRPMLTVKGT